jgi:hypothetical protein
MGPRDIMARSSGRYAEIDIGKDTSTSVDKLSKTASTFISCAIVGKFLIHSVKWLNMSSSGRKVSFRRIAKISLGPLDSVGPLCDARPSLVCAGSSLWLSPLLVPDKSFAFRSSFPVDDSESRGRKTGSWMLLGAGAPWVNHKWIGAGWGSRAVPSLYFSSGIRHCVLKNILLYNSPTLKEALSFKSRSSVTRALVKEYGPTPFAVSLNAQADMSSLTPLPSLAFAVPEAQQSKRISTSLRDSSRMVWMPPHFTIGHFAFRLFCQLEFSVSS